MDGITIACRIKQVRVKDRRIKDDDIEIVERVGVINLEIEDADEVDIGRLARIVGQDVELEVTQYQLSMSATVSLAPAAGSPSSPRPGVETIPLDDPTAPDPEPPAETSSEKYAADNTEAAAKSPRKRRNAA